MDVKARKSRFRKYTLMFFIVSILLMVVSGVLGGKNANDIYGEMLRVHIVMMSFILIQKMEINKTKLRNRIKKRNVILQRL